MARNDLDDAAALSAAVALVGELAGDVDVDVVESAACSFDVDPMQLWDELCVHDPELAAALAGIPVPVQFKLLRVADTNYAVGVALAKNLSCVPRVCAALAVTRDRKRTWRYAEALSNPVCPEALLGRAAEEGTSLQALAVAKNPACPEALLIALFDAALEAASGAGQHRRQEARMVSAAVLSNPACPDMVARKFAALSSSHQVSSNPKPPPSVSVAVADLVRRLSPGQ